MRQILSIDVAPAFSNSQPKAPSGFWFGIGEVSFAHRALVKLRDDLVVADGRADDQDVAIVPSWDSGKGCQPLLLAVSRTIGKCRK